jgi:pimeloyl-ACP methyl ester carboxylesterase
VTHNYASCCSPIPNDDGSVGPAYDPGIANAFSGPLQDVVLWPLWDAISCPTLVLRGAQSDLLRPADAQAMTQRGPKAKLVAFPGIGHAPALMATDQIATIRDFLLG